MYNNVERPTEYRNLLLDYIMSEYGIEAVSITPAKRVPCYAQ